MTKVLSRAQASSPLPFTDSPTVLGIKLDGSNYALWSQVVEMRVTRMRQGGESIEKYYNDIQGLWREIDFRRPNPMECTTDIQKYNSILQEERAYAHVRREDTRQVVMASGVGNASSGDVIATKGVKPGQPQTLPQLSLIPMVDSSTIVNDRGARTAPISPSLSLSHTLLVPFLSNKLMIFSTRRSLGVVLREGGFITWMILARERQITCKLKEGLKSKELANEPENEELVNDEPTNTPFTSVLEDFHIENTPKVSHSTTLSCDNTLDNPAGYVLHFRHNRGKPPNRYSPDEEKRRSKYPIAYYVTTQALSKLIKAFTHTLSSYHIPSSAIQEELEALQKNNTWRLVPLPEGKKLVGCKWVFSIKYKVDGSIDRYKARLMAKRLTQTYGVDYLETFSPVAKLNTVRVLLSLATNLDWPLLQLDGKNTFLHGDLEEEVYMDISSGYTTSSEAKIVCKLERALYGLKQSPRAWFD
ncbi:hypothetical protein AAG906_028478 [Vitis piasezkii]